MSLQTTPREPVTLPLRPGDRNPLNSPVIAGFVLSGAIAVISLIPSYFDPDSIAYIMIAIGDLRYVISPFTARFLYPYCARLLWLNGATDITSAFGILTAASLLLFCCVLAFTWRRMKILPTAIVLVALSPTLPLAYQNIYLPDLAHMALLACFFLALCHEQFYLSLLLLPLMYWVRESTLLICIFFFFFAWRTRGRRDAFLILILTLFSMFISGLFARRGQPNVHQLPGLIYLAMKVPYNFLSNILGIRLWTEGLHVPYRVKFTLPRALQIGAIREIGVGDVTEVPFFTLITWLTIFGVLPTVLLHDWRRRRRAPQLPPPAPWVKLAIAYGVTTFIIAPVLGSAVVRLITYGWPAFWIGAIFLLSRDYVLTRRQFFTLLACQLVASWFQQFYQTWDLWIFLPQIGFAILLHVIAWATLQHAAPIPRPAPTAALANEFSR